MLTRTGNNAAMRRSKGLWIVAALLAVNATLLVAQPGLALPGSLGNYFFGPKLVRASSRTAASSTTTASTGA